MADMDESEPGEGQGSGSSHGGPTFETIQETNDDTSERDTRSSDAVTSGMPNTSSSGMKTPGLFRSIGSESSTDTSSSKSTVGVS